MTLPCKKCSMLSEMRSGAQGPVLPCRLPRPWEEPRGEVEEGTGVRERMHSCWVGTQEGEKGVAERVEEEVRGLG